MTGWIPAIAPGVFFENVGDETLVLVGNPPQVVRLSPEASELLSLIQQNPGKEIEQTPALRQLVDLGVVEDTSPSTLSRRNVLQLSAVAGAVGLSTVLLPQAAMASSSESSSFYAMGTYEFVGGDNPWGFLLFRDDFPPEDTGTGSLAQAGTLTIDGADWTGDTNNSFFPDIYTIWYFVGDKDKFSGVVEGSLEFYNGKKYIVGFEEGEV